MLHHMVGPIVFPQWYASIEKNHRIAKNNAKDNPFFFLFFSFLSLFFLVCELWTQIERGSKKNTHTHEREGGLCVPVSVCCVLCVVCQTSVEFWLGLCFFEWLSLEQTVMSMNPRSTTLDSLSQVLQLWEIPYRIFLSFLFLFIYSFWCWCFVLFFPEISRSWYQTEFFLGTHIKRNLM